MGPGQPAVRGRIRRLRTAARGEPATKLSSVPNTFLPPCYRTRAIDPSAAFYEKPGFAETRRMPIGDEAINVFMALPGGDPILELTYHNGVTDYDVGPGSN